MEPSTPPPQALPKLVLKIDEATSSVPSSPLKTPSTTKRPLSNSLSSPLASSPSNSASAPPAFLTQSPALLTHKFRQIREHEDAIRDRPASLVTTPLALSRNRFSNVAPWAHHRVKLTALENGYINASPIDLGREGECFIATQGPTDGAHFYEMCWQESVGVVVMLTQAFEKGAEKCMVYYPKLRDQRQRFTGEDGVVYDVLCAEYKQESGIEVRTLQVSRAIVGDEADEAEAEVRTLHHFLFLGWPDFDVPKTRTDEIALLNLIKKTRFRIDGIDEGERDTKPRVIHCSAGVGRTGTFIALEHLMEQLEAGELENLEAGADPVFDTVKRLREQRMMMVYKETQYAFIYKMLRERWVEKHGGDALPIIAGDKKKRKLMFDDDDVGVYSDSVEKELSYDYE